MKFVRTSALALGLILLQATAWADVYSSALQKARNINEMNNARQGITGQPAPPPPAPPPQPDPVLLATLQNITNLQADLATLQRDPGRKQPLINDLNAAASGAHPSNESVTRVAEDLSSLLAGKTLPPDQLRKLAQALHAFSNSSHLSEAQQHALLAETSRVFQGPGSTAASDPKLSKLDSDLRAIIAATK